MLDTGAHPPGGGGLAYRHALLAEAARTDLRDPEGTHLAVAHAIETAAQDGDARAAEVARHLQQAGRDDLAAPRWQRAARHARSLGALPEAAAFWTEALRCDPDDAAARLELAEVYAWSGRAEDFEREWATALGRLAPAERAAAWCRRGLLFRTVACNPAESFAAYRRAEELLPRDAHAALRAEMLIGLAWTEASAGDPARSDPLLAEATELVPDPDDVTVVEMAERAADGDDPARPVRRVRGGGAARRDRDRARAAARLRLPRLDQRGERARLRRRPRRPRCAPPIGASRPPAACRWWRYPAWLRGRTCWPGSAATTRPPRPSRSCWLRPSGSTRRRFSPRRAMTPGSSPSPLARFREAAELLVSALDGEAAVSRPAARLAAAEALALCGDAAAAAAELRRAALEPVGPGDQPWALVPRMARVQGLVARARGDAAEARRRLVESAEGWRRRGGTTSRQIGEEYMASLVDLGRPPVVGLVEPDRELARVVAELAELEEAGCPGSR